MLLDRRTRTQGLGFGFGVWGLGFSGNGIEGHVGIYRLQQWDLGSYRDM